MTPKLPARIFLLSHMRAYSSLLGHIIGSHAEVNGYYEMHISYENNSQLNHQHDQYIQTESFKTGSQFLFDKILHNNYELDLNRLNLQQPKILIALRSPQQSIKSIINLFCKKDSKKSYSNPEQATRYYIQRLKKLSKFSQQNTKTYYYFDAELIISHTEELLMTLSNWIQLSTPLKNQYQLFSQTGRAGAGDSSQAIKAGEIIKSANHYTDIDLADHLLESAELAYCNYRQQILEHAIDSSSLS